MENLIKRLLRKWLKRKLVKIAIEAKRSIPTYYFKWIYDSPVRTWKDKLLIVRACDEFCEKYYDWLISDNM